MEDPVCLNCNCLLERCGHPVEFATAQVIENTFCVYYRPHELFELPDLGDYEGLIVKTERTERVGPHEQEVKLINYRKLKDGEDHEALTTTQVVR